MSATTVTSGSRLAVHTAVQNAPRRRRRQRTLWESETFVFDNLPAHQKDNKYIHRFYRANYDWKRSLRSLFSLHNETGNIWTHLIGVIIFLSLIAATMRVSPEPLSLGSDTLSKLESRLFAYGKSNLYELLNTVESWEARVVKAGHDGFNMVEERLRSFGQGNLHELVEFQDSLRKFGQRRVDQLTGFGQALKRVSQSGLDELAEMEARLVSLGPRAVTELDEAVQKALATVLDSQWPTKRWPVYVFISGAITCLFTSSLCHLFGCCAAHISTRIWRLDYAGIAVLIVTSFYPPVYYAFMCYPRARLFYLTLSTALGLACLAVSLLPKFQQPNYHRVRALTFVALGLWGAVPMAHAMALNSSEPAVRAAFGLDLIMALLYLSGALLYASRIPERWWPGKFDLLGHSHQIFHIMVVVAACVHYRAVRVLMHWRESTGGCRLMDV